MLVCLERWASSWSITTPSVGLSFIAFATLRIYAHIFLFFCLGSSSECPTLSLKIMFRPRLPIDNFCASPPSGKDAAFPLDLPDLPANTAKVILVTPHVEIYFHATLRSRLLA